MIGYRSNHPMCLNAVVWAVLAAIMVSSGAQAAADSLIDTSAGPMQITPLAQGLDEPWGIAHLPDGRFLVTERDRARLRLFGADGADLGDFAGLPAVSVGGQGGLLDVMIPRGFSADP
jgi:glucose/arabinose dehydrogenase